KGSPKAVDNGVVERGQKPFDFSTWGAYGHSLDTGALANGGRALSRVSPKTFRSLAPAKRYNVVRLSEGGYESSGHWGCRIHRFAPGGRLDRAGRRGVGTG